MLEASQITYDLPGRRLFDELTLRINDTDRIALVGPNGSGKSTLLKMLDGRIEPDRGQISRTKGARVGYLPQEGISHQGRSIVAEARSVFADLLALEREIADLEHHLSEGHGDEQSLSRYGEALEEFRRRGGYEMDARVANVLDGLGFERTDWELEASTLSGGWQMRLALAKLLIDQPDTLLLDEPTNHLDLLANNWLEDYLKSYPGGFVLVSHDRHFLDNIVTHVAELRFGRIKTFTGNYTHYLGQADKEMELLEERKRRQDEQIEKMERFITKFRYQATKAKQVQSRLKELDKIERIELPRPQSEVRFRFPEPPRSGRRVLELEGVRKAYGDKLVFRHLDLVVERGDRLALVGPNGAGKSTLMRILAGREAHEGVRRVGHNVSYSYFAQDEGANLDPSSTILDEVTKVAPLNVVPHLRTLLGAFLFRGDDVFKPIGVLSGGEKTRVALAKMLLEPYNLLLLDEPTNHLDLASKEVLLEALSDYPGTIVIVSHDRYFVDNLATRIADVGHGGAVLYPGGYEDYLSRPAPATAVAPAAAAVAAPTAPPAAARKSARPAAPPAGPGAPAATGKPARPAAGTGGKDPRKSREAARRRESLEKRIERAEEDLRSLELRMQEPGFFATPGSREEVARHQSLLAEVRQLYAEWDTLA